MIVIVRDTWRAVLVLVVGTLLAAMHNNKPTATQAPAPVWQPQVQVWQPPQQQWAQPQPERPLRRVASAMTELADSVIGVVR